MNSDNLIIVDAHAIGSEKGGNETYAYHLAEALDAVNTDGMEIVFAVNNEARSYFSLKKHKVLFRSLKSLIYRIFFFGKMCAVKKTKTLLHSQYFFKSYRNVKNIVTIHDVSWKPLNSFFSWPEKIYFMLVDRCILKADIVVTGSETVREDILDYYPSVNPVKVRVLPYGADHYLRFAEADACKPNDFGFPYILFVSNITPSKNLEEAIFLFSELIADEKFAHFKFVVVGRFKSASYAKKVFSLIKSLNCLENVIFIEDIKAQDVMRMASIYKGASALVHLSFSEGFGFVPLEALSLACVPLVSNKGSLPEVLGEDYPLMFALDDRKAMLKYLIRVLSDDTFKNDILRNYANKAEIYTWRSTAAKTVEIYREALGS